MVKVRVKVRVKVKVKVRVKVRVKVMVKVMVMVKVKVMVRVKVMVKVKVKMNKITERIQVSISEDDKKFLNELKEVFNQTTYSRVVQILIRLYKLKRE